MQHVNDDMDELFRKAGEEYPLHTGMPDWEKVASALQQVPTESEKKENNSRRLLWLLLLLPFAFVCNHYWIKDTEHTKPGAQQNTETAFKQIQPQQEKTNVSIPYSGGKQNLSGVANSNRRRSERKQYPTDVVSKNSSHQISFAAAKSSKNGNTSLEQVPGDPDKQSTGITRPKAAQEIEKNEKENQQSAANAVSLLENGSITDQLQAGLQPSMVYDGVYHQLKTDSLLQPDKLSTHANTSQRPKRLYVGVVGSADLTSVRLQRTGNVGWQAGVMAGYRWHRRWSVETGLSISRKYYYTEGEYFNKSRTYLPPNSRIMEVDGYCTMLEIPVNLKYDLVQKANYSWFAVAGLTSYLMKKEAYDFLYYYANTGSYAVHGKSYTNASKNLFSVLQVSGGYSRNMGGSFALRVEPYLKLPLTGLGYGKLRFSSTGLNIGVIKKL